MLKREFAQRGDDLLVIGFVGFPGSGKSEAAAIAQTEGFFPVAMGDAVRSHMQRSGIELSEKNVGTIANKLRADHGMDVIAKMCIPVVYGLTSQKVVIDGIRGIAEVNAFKREFTGDFKLIAIIAGPKVRFKRVKGRSRPDDARGLQRFEEKDERELAWGLEEALEAAEYSIENEGTLKELNSKISSLLERLVQPASNNTVTISIRTPIYETEVQEKVERAILNIFPDAALERVDNFIEGTSGTLETFSTLLRKQRIRTTAKAELMKGLMLDSFEFALNKQVALVGKVNFSQDPLGPIFVRVVAPLPEKLIDTITNESLL
ncbi:MAG: flagellar hook-basal body complex protein FliE [Euryarchaeota archaeon]|nr:flagellar hook-basal body complex protein FliE [Euryarchaeota archaeon]